MLFFTELQRYNYFSNNLGNYILILKFAIMKHFSRHVLFALVFVIAMALTGCVEVAPDDPEDPEQTEQPQEQEQPQDPETPPEETEDPETPPEETEDPEEPQTPEDPEPPEVVPTLGTGLRSVFIVTPEGVGINSKDVWTNGCSLEIVDDNGKSYYQNTQVGVKGRGNSTWGYPKKPYTLKLPEKEDLIGVGAKGKRWVLLANWMDRTLLRNDVAFEIARRTRLEWTPSGEFVELFINGVHQGNYWLGEQIKVGKGRLDADWLIEMDTYYDATWRFYSSYGRRVNDWKTGMPIGVKEPDDDEMNADKLQEIKDLVSGVEEAIYKSKGRYDEKINVPSFIDWYLVHELTYNLEPNHPKSCYFYFRGGVMYAGPVWDFDWYTFVPVYDGLGIRYSIYFEKLFLYPAFVSDLKARWQELKPLLADMDSYIDSRAAQISASEAVNWTMWPCNYDVNGDCWLSFRQSVDRMKKALSERISAVDAAIAAL